MSPRTKPLPFGTKLAKMYAGKFILSREANKELLMSLEEGSMKRDKEAVAFIDQHGEWLDG